MCMHWQNGAANEYYEKLQSKTDLELQEELNKCKMDYDKDLKEAIAYHGSKENIRSSWFAGKLYASRLFGEAVLETIERRKLGLKPRDPLPKNVIIVWR